MTAPSTARPGGLDRRLSQQLAEFRRDGVYKKMLYLESPQASRVRIEGRGDVIILSSNNYLGLSDDRRVMAAGKAGIDRFGAGTASVRFICGTFTIHRELETALAELVGTAASTSFVSCWNANEALPATILTANDVIFSDQLNHASIIDAMRLAKSITKCETAVFRHADYADLDRKLAAAADKDVKLVVSDGVFSMEGSIVDLPTLLEVCRKHGALVWLDDSHATGVLGPGGRGTAEHYGLLGEVDLITSTLGKALGGAAGGFAAGSEAVCDYLVQRARPQLFTNALPATVAASALEAVRILRDEPDRVARLRDNAAYFRGRLGELGFRPLPGDTPIVPVILGETAAAIRMSELLLDRGVFVTGFGYPVVPQGEARVRCQISAGHTRDDLDQALDAFAQVGRELKLI
jgi:glycine C-acetyltransferase